MTYLCRRTWKMTRCSHQQRKVLRTKKEKAIQRRRQKRNHRLLAVFAVAGVILLWLLLRLLPIPFGALIVDGNESLSFDDVYRASGVPGYVNVIQLSPDDIQERLSKDLRIERAVERTKSRCCYYNDVWICIC